ncbi:hypothetical protein BJF79_28285 [Actinomadura sp. CNU-125]|nr:hypothetical protein BJF79_28285 [Actinomadura sp. CNU-125]
MTQALSASATATSTGVKPMGLWSATQPEPFHRTSLVCGLKKLPAEPTAHPAFFVPKSTLSRLPS